MFCPHPETAHGNASERLTSHENQNGHDGYDEGRPVGHRWRKHWEFFSTTRTTGRAAQHHLRTCRGHRRQYRLEKVDFRTLEVLPLAQACRQLRAEVLPIFTTIALKDKTWVVQLPGKPFTPVGYPRVVEEDSWSSRRPGNTRKRTDITPLLQCPMPYTDLARSPSLHFDLFHVQKYIPCSHPEGKFISCRAGPPAYLLADQFHARVEVEAEWRWRSAGWYYGIADVSRAMEKVDEVVVRKRMKREEGFGLGEVGEVMRAYLESLEIMNVQTNRIDLQPQSLIPQPQPRQGTKLFISDTTFKMAAAQHPNTPFRFLHLPAELRIKMYNFYLETSPRNAEVNLLRYHSHLPASNLNLACRQIYSECQGLFEAKRSAFLRNNTFLLIVGRPMQEGRATILRDVLRLPSALHIHNLAIDYTSTIDWLAPTRIEAELQTDGRIRWKIMFKPRSNVETVIYARLHGEAMRALQTFWWNVDGALAELNIELCLRAVCRTSL
ncbi:hypothetical protein LTR37_013486 [Vermiconidia calcicola]|uniref:Uncharacterized protein n=1 Tax=Vermiconidia calcicola TaxID=1690605 RepID=A0ACC3MX07_9PEZI|nr:hypothetical protein LTR37_013486 [Vermiconidia calcicola]